MNLDGLISKHVNIYLNGVNDKVKRISRLMDSVVTKYPRVVEECDKAMELTESVKEEYNKILSQLVYEKFTDHMTKVPNRKAMVEVLNAEIYERVESLFNSVYDDNDDTIVGIADLDLFKIVNDTNGHRTGDDVLKTFFRDFGKLEGMMLLSRHGGDEGAFLMEVAEGQTDKEIVERVYDSVHDIYYKIGGRHYVSSASVGMMRLSSLDWIIEEVRDDILGKNQEKGYCFIDILREMQDRNVGMEGSDTYNVGNKTTSTNGRYLLSNLKGVGERESKVSSYDKYLSFIKNNSGLILPKYLESKIEADNGLSVFSLVDGGGLKDLLKEDVLTEDIFTYLDEPTRLTRVLSSVAMGVADLQTFYVKENGRSGVRLGKSLYRFDESSDQMVYVEK